ncbi:MAG: hypothetical protein EOL89_10480 [Actinobacteria bacterium]|nr:hypothetical protein [Actinomycetota bacterium]
MTSLQPVLFPVVIDSATDPLLRAVAAHLARPLADAAALPAWDGDDRYWRIRQVLWRRRAGVVVFDEVERTNSG